jgi:hypothetical protein
VGIFDLLGIEGSSKKIYRDKFRKALRKILELSDKEREYAEEAFKEELSGGLSKFEIKERCRKLKHKAGDLLESSEVRKIKEKLLKYFE